MKIKGIKIDEDVARILNEQDKDDTSKYRVYSNDIKDGWSILGTYDDEYSALQVYDAWKLRLLRGNGRYGVYTDVRMFKPGEKAIFSGWASLYDYVSKAFDRLAAGYSHPSQVPDFLQTRDLLEKLTKHELKLAKQEFFEEDLQAALDRWFEEADDYTNESINEEFIDEPNKKITVYFNNYVENGQFVSKPLDIIIGQYYSNPGSKYIRKVIGYDPKYQNVWVDMYNPSYSKILRRKSQDYRDFENLASQEKIDFFNKFQQEQENKEQNIEHYAVMDKATGDVWTYKSREERDKKYKEVLDSYSGSDYIDVRKAYLNDDGDFVKWESCYNKNDSINKNSKSEKENEIKIDEDVARILNEQDNDFPEGSFAAWYGEDLSGQTYEGDLNCSHQKLTSLFGCPSVVIGDFDCSNNQLASLKGAPEKVKGKFDCSFNNLTSLEGAPEKVKGKFDCSFNNLTSLEGAPKEAGWTFNCSNNKLTTLEGAPKEVKWDFDCSHNDLTSLEGSPEKIRMCFDCSYNKLTSLKGAPEEIKCAFDCSFNNLTSLKGAPQKLGGGLYCYNNQLTSLEGAPEKVGSSFDCSNNRLTTLEGAPKEVEWNFDCSHNKLISLEGAPEYVENNFICKDNPDLKSLDGISKVKGRIAANPELLGIEFPKGSFAEWFGEDLTGDYYQGDIDCSNQGLTSLYGCPKDVRGDFNCSNNNLTSLEGAPEESGKSFDCSYNQLITLKGAPKLVEKDFNCSHNSLKKLSNGPKIVRGGFDCSYNLITSLSGSPKYIGEDLDCRHNPLKDLKIAYYPDGDILSDFEDFEEEQELELIDDAWYEYEGEYIQYSKMGDKFYSVDHETVYDREDINLDELKKLDDDIEF